MIRYAARALARLPGLGCWPDPGDHRDKTLRDLLGAGAGGDAPLYASVRQDIGPKSQGRTNSCTGMAWAQGYRTACLARGLPCPELSGLFPYYLGRAEWGGESRDDGSNMRSAAKAVMRFGVPTEDAWRFRLSRVNRQPSFGALRDAYDRRGLRGYYSISDGDVDGVRRALAAGFPVVGALRVDEAFVQHKGPPLIESIGEPIGGHAFLIEEYGMGGTFGFLNSYGTSYRNGGRCRFTEQVARGLYGLWAIDVRPD